MLVLNLLNLRMKTYGSSVVLRECLFVIDIVVFAQQTMAFSRCCVVFTEDLACGSIQSAVYDIEGKTNQMKHVLPVWVNSAP